MPIRVVMGTMRRRVDPSHSPARHSPQSAYFLFHLLPNTGDTCIGEPSNPSCVRTSVSPLNATVSRMNKQTACPSAYEFIQRTYPPQFMLDNYPRSAQGCWNPPGEVYLTPCRVEFLGGSLSLSMGTSQRAPIKQHG